MNGMEKGKQSTAEFTQTRTDSPGKPGLASVSLIPVQNQLTPLIIPTLQGPIQWTRERGSSSPGKGLFCHLSSFSHETCTLTRPLKIHLPFMSVWSERQLGLWIGLAWIDVHVLSPLHTPHPLCGFVRALLVPYQFNGIEQYLVATTRPCAIVWGTGWLGSRGQLW